MARPLDAFERVVACLVLPLVLWAVLRACGRHRGREMQRHHRGNKPISEPPAATQVWPALSRWRQACFLPLGLAFLLAGFTAFGGLAGWAASASLTTLACSSFNSNNRRVNLGYSCCSAFDSPHIR